MAVPGACVAPGQEWPPPNTVHATTGTPGQAQRKAARPPVHHQFARDHLMIACHARPPPVT